MFDDTDDLEFYDFDNPDTKYPDPHACPFCSRSLRDEDTTVCECRHCLCRWCAECDRTRNIGPICKLCGMIEFEVNERGLRAPLLPEWCGKF